MTVNTSSPVEILCRYDGEQKMPVVFIANTYDPTAKTIEAWVSGAGPQLVQIDYYHGTGPLSAADEKTLCGRYTKETGQGAVVRHRLPRQARTVPNRLSRAAKQEQAPAVEKTSRKAKEATTLPAVNGLQVGPTPEQLLAAIEQTRIQLVQLTELAAVALRK